MNHAVGRDSVEPTFERSEANGVSVLRKSGAEMLAMLAPPLAVKSARRSLALPMSTVHGPDARPKLEVVASHEPTGNVQHSTLNVERSKLDVERCRPGFMVPMRGIETVDAFHEPACRPGS